MPQASPATRCGKHTTDREKNEERNPPNPPSACLSLPVAQPSWLHAVRSLRHPAALHLHPVALLPRTPKLTTHVPTTPVLLSWTVTPPSLLTTSWQPAPSRPRTCPCRPSPPSLTRTAWRACTSPSRSSAQPWNTTCVPVRPSPCVKALWTRANSSQCSSRKTAPSAKSWSRAKSGCTTRPSPSPALRTAHPRW